MTEKYLFAVHNYLKDRDAYGFALRPQHVQIYQEYLSIYTEEETERAEKWKNFLDRQDSAADSSSDEEFQDTLQADGADSGKESASEEGSRNGKHESGYLKECELGGLGVQQHLEKDSTETVGGVSKEEELAEETHVLERKKSLGRNSESVKDEGEQFEFEKEKESSVESESGEVSKEEELAEEAHVLDREKSLERNSESVKDEDEHFESEKEKESSVESESGEVSREKELAEEAHLLEKEKSPGRNSESVKDEDEQFESEKEKESSSVERESGEVSKEKLAEEAHLLEKKKSLERNSEPVKDEDEKFESENENESSAESESNEEKQSQPVKEPVDHVSIQQENATEKLVAEEEKCGLDHEKAQKDKKPRSVIKWANIRPCLASIEAMMCSRVKNVKYMQNKRKTEFGDHASSIHESLTSIEEFEQKSGENDRGIETSTSRSHSIKEEHDAQGSVSSEPFFPWYEELEVLVRLGVPKDLRGEVWQAFVGVKARRVDRYYQNLLAQITDSDESSSDVERKWKKQIEKDIPRTFPGHPALNEAGRDSLRRILLAYACHNPSVGYCQAMNFFAGLLLLLMPEENAFWTMVGIIDDYFDGYYTEEMIESQVDQLVFEELMRERFPKLVNHLDYLGVQVAWISGPWFLSIFVNILPWDCVLRMWDVLLFEGNRVVLFRTAFALMELYGPAIVATNDAGDAITSLQSLASSTFDSSQLILTACMGYISTNEARLEELRKIHRPSVLEIVEERIQKGRVWKDKKGLASKLYSFKHEGSILDEQKSTQRADGENPDDDNESGSPKCSQNLDGAIVASESDSLPDLQEQVVWMKVELCRLLEEKRSAVMRAEELEIAFMEMVKEDNRLELNARIEQLEKEVKELKQVLSEKKEQETAMLQVLMKVEQDQKLTEDARINAEQEAAAQKYAVHVLQEKNEKLMTQIAQLEKKLVTAETTLEATLQYESGQNKALSSPRFARTAPENPKKAGFLSFGLGWRNKAKQSEESNSDNTSNATSEIKSPSKDSVSGKGSNLSNESKTEDLLNPETRR